MSDSGRMVMGPGEWGLLVALSALIVLLHARGHRLPDAPGAWAAFLIMGALNNALPFSLIFWGQLRIAGGLAAILNATTPLFTVVLAQVVTRDERLTANRLGGVLLGLAGVAVLVGMTALDGLGQDVLAQLAVLGAALAYAGAGLFGRRFRGRPPLVTAAGQLTAAWLLMLPVAPLTDRPWTLAAPGLPTWGALLGMALPSTAVAYLIYFRLLATVGATNLLLVTFLIPVSALGLGLAFLGARLDPREVAGMALIGRGLAAIDGRPLALIRRWARRGTRPAPGAVDGDET